MLSTKLFPVVCVGLLEFVLFEVYPICLLSMDAIYQPMYPGRLSAKEYHNLKNLFSCVNAVVNANYRLFFINTQLSREFLVLRFQAKQLYCDKSEEAILRVRNKARTPKYTILLFALKSAQ